MIHVGNCSSKRQWRWATAVVPNQDANTLPDYGLLRGTYFAKGGRRPCGRNIHLLVDLPGYALGGLPGGPVLDVPPVKPALSALVPDPSNLKTYLKVGNDEAEFQVVAVQTDSPYRTRIHMRAGLKGYFSEMWFDVWSWQDFVDIYGYTIWSDRENAYHVAQELGDSVSIRTTLGTYYLDYEGAWGLVDGGTISPVAEAYPDGMMFPFYGIWVPPIPDEPPEGDPLGGMWDQRMSTLEAAQEGPIMAVASNINGNLFAGGGTFPKALSSPDPTNEFFRFLSNMSHFGKIHDPREFASPKKTGNAGDQKPFSFNKDYVLGHDADPRRLWQLRESTVDYMLRCHHHRETDGKPLRKSDHEGWWTWNLVTHSLSPDKLGKGSATPGGSHAFSRAMVDDQHRGDDYISTVRHATDDPLLEVDLFDRTQGDLARAKRAIRSHITSPSDAPRAAGRLLKSWAKGWWTTWNPELQEAFHTLSVEEFELWEEFVKGPEEPLARSTLGPVRPAGVEGAQTRVLSGGPAIMPWQDCLFCVGLLHQRALWAGEGGDLDLATRVLALFEEIAGTCLKYGTVRALDGLLYPLNGVLWLPNGEPNPPAYYTFPRAGASFQDAYDMLVGTRGWFGNMGWPAVAKAYYEFGADPARREIAREIMEEIILPVNTTKEAEWLAL